MGSFLRRLDVKVDIIGDSIHVTKKWVNLGFLDGLKGHIKPNIAELYESEASRNSYTKGHKPAAVKNMEEAKRIKENKIWWIYMVECADGTIYTGISNNVSKRILTHNSGKGAKYTRSRLPVTLKWSQSCENRSEASKEEYKIKKLTRKEKLQKIEEYGKQ